MKLPFSIDLKLVFRLLLPGFLTSLALWPLTSGLLDAVGFAHLITDAFLILVLVTGWLFVVSDMHLYMLLEGRRFWPAWLRAWGVRRQTERLDRLLAQVSDRTNGSRQSRQEAWVEIRQYPLDRDGRFEATYPSRLGNLLTAFETYPERAYGMDSIFYWYRIWIVADKDLRNELDQQQAVVDSAVYSTCALGLAALLGLLYALLGLATDWPGLPAPLLSVGLAVLALLAAVVIYRLSLPSHQQFGELFKALFDHYRSKIELDAIVKIAEEQSSETLGSLTERRKARAAWRYLQYHLVRTPDGLRIANPDVLQQPSWVRPAPAEVPAADRGGGGDDGAVHVDPQ